MGAAPPGSGRTPNIPIKVLRAPIASLEELQAIFLSGGSAATVTAAALHAPGGAHPPRGIAIIPPKRTPSFLLRHSEAQPHGLLSPSPRTSCGSDASFPGGRGGSMCHSPSGVTLMDAGHEDCGGEASRSSSHGPDPRRGGESVRSSIEMSDSVRAMKAALAGREGRRSLTPSQTVPTQRPEVSKSREGGA